MLRILRWEGDSSAQSFFIFLSYDHYHITTIDTRLYTKPRSITPPTSDVASISKGDVEQRDERRVLRIFGQERDSSAHSFVIFLSYDHNHITTIDTRLYTKTRSISRHTSDVASISKEEVEQSVEGRVLRIFRWGGGSTAHSFFIFLMYIQHPFTSIDTRLYTKTWPITRHTSDVASISKGDVEQSDGGR